MPAPSVQAAGKVETHSCTHDLRSQRDDRDSRSEGANDVTAAVDDLTDLCSIDKLAWQDVAQTDD